MHTSQSCIFAIFMIGFASWICAANALSSSASLEQKANEARVFGYGLTDTGRTVLTGVLVIALGIAVYGLLNGRNGQKYAKKKQFNELNHHQKRHNFIQQILCKLNPDLKKCHYFDEKVQTYGHEHTKRLKSKYFKYQR